MFVTDHGVRYEVSFVIDYTLDIDNSYQLCIDNVDNKQQPRDIKVRDTIAAIVENFFKNNALSLLYICDTSDGRQSARNRIFKIWFEQKAPNELYTILPASVVVDGEEYFASLILCKNHPEYDIITEAFMQFSKNLSDKWND